MVFMVEEAIRVFHLFFVVYLRCKICDCVGRMFLITPIFPKSINAPNHIVPADENMTSKVGCCKVDAIVTVDSKGQIVLPKDLRERAKLKPDDKLALIGCEQDGEICCIMMVRADDLGSSVKVMLGPTLKEIFR